MLKNKFVLLRKTYPYFKPFFGINILSLVLEQLSAFLNLLLPLMIKILIDDVIVSGDTDRLLKFGLILTIIVCGGVIFGFLAAVLYAVLSEKTVVFGRDKLFFELLHYNMKFHDKTPFGEIITRLRDDSGYLHTLFSYCLNIILSNALKVIVILSILWWMNYRMTLLVICTVPIYLFINKYFGDRVQRQIALYRGYLSKLMTFFHDVFTKLQTIKNFNYEDEIHQNHLELSNEIKYHAVKTEIMGYFAQSLTSMTTLLSSVAVLWLGGSIVMNGNSLTVGELVAFYSYLNQIMGPARELANSNVVVKKAKNSIERYFEYVDLRVEYSEVLNQSDTCIPKTKIGLQGEIRFDSVTFMYEDERPLLTNLNLHIKEREKIVIYGPSGIGKSSIVKMLKMFYLPVEGTILLDGVSLEQYPLALIRQQIGYIPQEPKIFCDTIERNLRIGKKDATEEELWRVLETVNLSEFVRSLPDQLNTFLPNNGSTISGGQKQRLAIARLMLQNPKVVIFDEFLTNIDPISQNIILNNMHRWCEDKTVIFISHEKMDKKYIDTEYFFDENRTIRLFTENEVKDYWKAV